MNYRNIFISLSVLFLLFSIPAAVYLASQQQVTISQASTPSPPPQSLNILTKGGDSFTTNSREVTLKVTFLDKNTTPTKVKVANLLEELDSAPEVTFTSPSTEIPWVLPPQLTSHTVFAQLLINNKWQSPLMSSVILSN